MKTKINSLILLAFFGILVGLCSCSKDKEEDGAPQTPVQLTTEQKISGYVWTCSRAFILHYMNGNSIGITDTSYSMMYCHFKTDHTYDWDAVGTGTWSVPDATHLMMDGKYYDIQTITDHALTIYGEQSQVITGNVYLDKATIYFTK